MKAVGRLLLCAALACPLLTAAPVFPAIGATTSEPAHPHAQDAIDDWLAAFNAGSLDALHAFADKYAKKEGSGPGDYLEFRGSTGPLRVLETREGAPGHAKLLVMGQLNERAMWVTAEMDADHPAHLKLFQIEGTGIPDKYKPERVALPALMADARTKLDALRAQDALSGALLVARNGQVLLDWRGGQADREGGIPVRADTRFRLASSNKMFTSVAILQLVQAGKLGLDDTIGKHLPDYPNKAVAAEVTVRQLLTHTSGLGDFFGDDFEQYSASLKTLDDYVQRFAKDAPQFTPGSQDSYSNYGFIVLGRLIETVSGQSYHAYVEQHILRPAGMTGTGFEPETVKVPQRAVAYTKKDGQWVRETKSLPWRGMSAGGGYSTATDMLKFAEALRGGKLVPPALLQQATTAQNHKRWYGFGFVVQGEGREHQYGHEGGAPGSNSAIVVLPAQGYVIVGLANVDPDAIGNVVNYIARRLPLQ
ncbi:MULTISPECIES: serine hydrolase domain-containing protein [Stenotrophomonas]|jgi:CubicO group peptidase (beta-lactamase class C family)|uniref:serine hydrolase domain-containing protein n=1 Tax=Stenotrophomonas TaxID=40323 RepID=UPI00201CC017|nr:MULTISPECIES: serine hydrolase domain-containing protein [Stenotrophomonas]MBN5025375.1 beta-lactamase family protein [Stenotrophomonas maltophilia]MDH1272942.1 beta-lactamase family protein [Stenotrophomonas sp. GD03937]MDH1484244.1 beta-lactamase family protein [Stenotrophomonas sp. GD03712]UQY96076.1 beta-lactamase family protein [Stenotrophomonas maltophilia]WON67277.1 serine hydrolase domain-containing protein [Stenotrophomonas maltophilia]